MEFIPISVGILAALLTVLVLSRHSRSKGRPSKLPDTSQGSPLDDVTGIHQDAQGLLAQQLMPGESVRIIIQGPSNQAIIATERRLFVYKRGSVAGAWFGQKMGSWDYRNITGIEMEKGPLGGAIIVQVPGAPVIDRGYFSAFELPNGLPILSSSYDAAAKGVAEVRRLISEHQSAGSAIGGGLAQELERLANLHERGQLTDAEFATMKRRLVGPS